MAENKTIDETQCTDNEREDEFLLLMQQVEEDRYNGDGPDDITPVDEEDYNYYG